MLEIIDQGFISHVPGRGAYFPCVRAMQDGSLLAVQHVGKGLCSADNFIEVLRSTDGCQTWTNEGSIHGSERVDAWCYRVPMIVPMNDGGLLMAATRYLLDNDEMYNPLTEGLKPAQMILYRSQDLGKSWSGPQVVPNPLPAEKYVCSLSGQLMILSPERWMFPFETWKPDGYDGPVDQKAGAVFSSDQGQTWTEWTVVADDPEEGIHFGDQMQTLLPDGRIYTTIWTRSWGVGQGEDVRNHFVVSEDDGRNWTEPRPTNLLGQLCAPIALPDGRVAAIYNYRKEPQGIHVAITEDLEFYDIEHQVTVFRAGRETVTSPAVDEFIDAHQKIAFGRPWGTLLPDGDLLVFFWCTVDSITHNRWVRLRIY